MQSEFFIQVEDYPLYEVSDQGRIRNIQTGRLIKPSTNPSNGWIVVCLRKDGRSRTIPLNRLVAIAFLEAPVEPNTSVIHIDGDRSNNQANNLAWKPRWFAVRYMREINLPRYHRREQLYAEYTGEVFDSVAHVASVVLALPSMVFAGSYGADKVSYPSYGTITRKLFTKPQTLRGL